jgi:hypothetical protein
MTIGLGALLKALQLKFDDIGLDDTYGIETLTLWPWGAPEGVSAPFMTIAPGPVDVDYTMSSSRMETIPVSISTWLAKETFESPYVLAASLSYAEAIIALFDDCTLDFGSDNWSLIRMGRTGYFIGPDPDRGWQIRIDYECMIEEV